MILVYTSKATSRARYIFDFLLNGILGQEMDLVTDRSVYDSFDGPRINYSGEDDRPGLFFDPAGLLHERGIRGHDLNFMEYGEVPVCFPVFNKKSVLPFDLFSYAFYLLARYEEYLPYVRDAFGRFRAEDSIAWREGFLRKPVIDILAFRLMDILQQAYPRLEKVPRNYRFISTIDINAAYAYKHKGIVRIAWGIARTLRDLNGASLLQQLRVFLNREPDPFDHYGEQLAIQRKYGLDVIYFVLFSPYGTNDRNISLNNRKFQVLIKTLGDYSRVGIHASFGSTHNPSQLSGEIQNLSWVLKREIECVRQHLLLLQIPQTYRNYINEDIFEDYSMGYPMDPGFRAGTSYPFRFFDLDMETITKLVVHPFAFQDIAFENGYTLKDYTELTGQVSAVNGDMILLFSNENFSRKILNKKGLELYEMLINYGIGNI